MHHRMGSMVRTPFTFDITRSQCYTIWAVRRHRDHGGLLRRFGAIFSNWRKKWFSENVELQYRNLYTRYND